MTDFDFIFTGGGCAALSLVLEMVKYPELQSKRILILEKTTKDQHDRTWCFWESGAGPFESVVFKSWQTAWFHSARFSRLLDLAPYRYKMIRSQDFYRFVKEKLRSFPLVEWKQTEVTGIEKTAHGPRVKTMEGVYSCQYVFNSIPAETEKKEGHHYLYQHFKGWFIQTKEPCFLQEEATLMDFRIDQHNECRFMYVLPVSDREALVEFTLFSAHLLKPEAYDEAIASYLREKTAIRDFTITQTEFGCIPMFSEPFQKQDGNQIIHIGSAGGMTKASTGYTFTRIQRHSSKMAESLAHKNKPYLEESPGEKRFAYYDRVLLHVLARKKASADKVFERLFKYNKPSAVFRFLDEDTHFLQEYRLLNTVPVFRFIGPGWQELLRR